MYSRDKSSEQEKGMALSYSLTDAQMGVVHLRNAPPSSAAITVRSV
jgi:hypothetical protein